MMAKSFYINTFFDAMDQGEESRHKSVTNKTDERKALLDLADLSAQADDYKRDAPIRQAQRERARQYTENADLFTAGAIADAQIKVQKQRSELQQKEFTKAGTLINQATPENYAQVFKQLPQSVVKAYNFTGKWDTDVPKLSIIRGAWLDTQKHAQALALQNNNAANTKENIAAQGRENRTTLQASFVNQQIRDGNAHEYNKEIVGIQAANNIDLLERKFGNTWRVLKDTQSETVRNKTIKFANDLALIQRTYDLNMSDPSRMGQTVQLINLANDYSVPTSIREAANKTLNEMYAQSAKVPPRPSNPGKEDIRQTVTMMMDNEYLNDALNISGSWGMDNGFDPSDPLDPESVRVNAVATTITQQAFDLIDRGRTAGKTISINSATQYALNEYIADLSNAKAALHTAEDIRNAAVNPALRDTDYVIIEGKRINMYALRQKVQASSNQ